VDRTETDDRRLFRDVIVLHDAAGYGKGIGGRQVQYFAPELYLQLSETTASF